MNAITFYLRGLTCAACVTLAKKRLAAMPGVATISINPSTGLTSVSATRKIELAEITAVLASAGYSTSRLPSK